MTMKALLGRLASLCLLFVLTACQSLLPLGGPAPELYNLESKGAFDDELPEVSWQLIVEPPHASAAINTTRVALRTSPVQFDYFSRANWIDRAPLMVQTLMIESFENTGRIVAVGREAVGLRPDFILKSDLRQFQAIERGPASYDVHVVLDAKLVQMPDRQIVAATRSESVVSARGSSMSAIVTAFDEALGEVLREVVQWTLLSGETAWAARTVRGALFSDGGPGPLPGRDAGRQVEGRPMQREPVPRIGNAARDERNDEAPPRRPPPPAVPYTGPGAS